MEVGLDPFAVGMGLLTGRVDLKMVSLLSPEVDGVVLAPLGTPWLAADVFDA